MSLPPPDAALEAVVVVPARDEEALVGDCLAALAGQRDVAPHAYEVVLVLDACADGTRAEAERAATAHPHLRLLLVDGPGAGAGAARRRGMDLACARLLALGRADGLVACTDADSRPRPGWLAAQLAAVRAGARAVGGRAEPPAEELAALGPAVVEGRRRAAADRLARLAGEEPGGTAPEHHQFSGASMAVTAATYAEVGGLEPLPALEDEGFERRLRRHRVPIHRSAAVHVDTSGRRTGRAGRGLARDLALADWVQRRTYEGRGWVVEDLLAAKAGRSLSVVLPSREVATTVGSVLDVLLPLREAGLVDELVVVDAASGDGTADVAAARGATVLQEDDLRREFGPCRGKGDAMWRALSATTGELVCFCDADTDNITPDFVLGLLAPALVHPELELVKGAFRRPFRLGDRLEPDGGGRVTELVARPVLNLHRPELAGFIQPLAGEIVARREVLETIPFPVGYGVEIAMLLDVHDRVGLDALAQVRLGTRQNAHQSLRSLSAMAYAVLVAAARRLGDEPDAPGPLLLPGADGFESRSVPVEERPPAASLPADG